MIIFLILFLLVSIVIIKNKYTAKRISIIKWNNTGNTGDTGNTGNTGDNININNNIITTYKEYSAAYNDQISAQAVETLQRNYRDIHVDFTKGVLDVISLIINGSFIKYNIYNTLKKQEYGDVSFQSAIQVRRDETILSTVILTNEQNSSNFYIMPYGTSELIGPFKSYFTIIGKSQAFINSEYITFLHNTSISGSIFAIGSEGYLYSFDSTRKNTFDLITDIILNKNNLTNAVIFNKFKQTLPENVKNTIPNVITNDQIKLLVNNLNLITFNALSQQIDNSTYNDDILDIIGAYPNFRNIVTIYSKNGNGDIISSYAVLSNNGIIYYYDNEVSLNLNNVFNNGYSKPTVPYLTNSNVGSLKRETVFIFYTSSSGRTYQINNAGQVNIFSNINNCFKYLIGQNVNPDYTIQPINGKKWVSAYAMDAFDLGVFITDDSGLSYILSAIISN